MDHVSPEVRSRMMSEVKTESTEPELAVRSHLHRAGLRFRLHRDDLAGSPDIVLPKYGAVVFVHGCFWHQHENCPKARLPSTNREFWEKKLARNRARDRRNRSALEDAGWRVFEVWECEVNGKQLDNLVRSIKKES